MRPFSAEFAGSEIEITISDELEAKESDQWGTGLLFVQIAFARDVYEINQIGCTGFVHNFGFMNFYRTMTDA